MSYLLLWLEGPLQSWGADSKYYNRTTLPFPTKSGILGLLCCASGRGGEQKEWLEHMSGYSMTVRAYVRTQCGQPVRNPILRDFQMVGSGYDLADLWQNLLVPKTAEGKKPVGSGAKITYKYYLQDMAFACIYEMLKDEAEEIDRALKEPVCPICLGRRNCVPTAPVRCGFFETEEEARTYADDLAGQKQRICIFTVCDGIKEDSDDTWTIRDIPIQFGLYKKYSDRQVSIFIEQQ